MKHLFTHIASILLILTLLSSAQACQQSSKESIIEQAEYACSIGQYDKAQDLCDRMANDSTLNKLSVNELCRLSLLLLLIDEHTESNESNIATATSSIHTACKHDMDSVVAYINTLTIEDQSKAILLMNLSGAGQQSCNIAEKDSLNAIPDTAKIY